MHVVVRLRVRFDKWLVGWVCVAWRGKAGWLAGWLVGVGSSSRELRRMLLYQVDRVLEGLLVGVAYWQVKTLRT